MKKITTGGLLTLHGEKLLLDGNLIEPETIIITQYGEGDPLPGTLPLQGLV